ncbi:GerAB/ArcD/ProY family transporter [Paenibacillus chondroitinus]|uniref:GerAB/ArcD/ProY family transporter n=1 Tax=Paenibacillus chondroitinus TaxID=59842 RepID=A0ABU6DHX8_9BACL|nr:MULTISPECIES: GerAB/ArcD/ProY family transporter [Paenibacillus]MCY9659574.1 spore germination protein [Paenibacillus anseongense]MEB4796970.1 GerAB/ArcD/ProY family transporter [Paenibacillus chondroitinus]
MPQTGNTYENNKITRLQFIFLIHGMQVGVGVITMPSTLAGISGTDGWIAIIGGWVCSVVASLAMIQIMKKYPGGTVIDLVRHYFGKWSGTLLTLVFAVYMILFAYLIFDRMALLIKTWIMQQSYTYVLMLLFVVPAFMVVKGGVRSLGRFAEVVILSTVWMPFILLYVFKEANWINLLPVLKEGWMPVWHSVSSTILSFLGFEGVLFFYPYLENKKTASANVVIANTLTLAVYLFVTIICFVVFSPDEITQYQLAPLSAAKIIEYRFLERFDIIFLSVYTLLICKTWFPALHIAVQCTEQLIAKGKTNAHMIVLLAGMIAITFIWDLSWHDSKVWIAYFNQLGVGVAYLLPFVLWGLLNMKNWIVRWRN